MNDNTLTTLAHTTTGTLSIDTNTGSVHMIPHTSWKRKYFKLGNTKIMSTNLMNREVSAEKVNFSFITTEQGVDLNIHKEYSDITFKSLDELRDYLKRLKEYYIKAKEFEKQLNILSDFS